jgi:hypothetical protein
MEPVTSKEKVTIPLAHEYERAYAAYADAHGRKPVDADYGWVAGYARALVDQRLAHEPRAGLGARIESRTVELTDAQREALTAHGVSEIPGTAPPPGDARVCLGGCELTLAQCYDASRRGAIKCCPDCDHRAGPTKGCE